MSIPIELSRPSFFLNLLTSWVRIMSALFCSCSSALAIARLEIIHDNYITLLQVSEPCPSFMFKVELKIGVRTAIPRCASRWWLSNTRIASAEKIPMLPDLENGTILLRLSVRSDVRYDNVYNQLHLPLFFSRL